MSRDKLLSLLSLLEHTISEIRKELTEIDESIVIRKGSDSSTLESFTEYESSPVPLDDYDEVFYDDE